MESPFTSSQFLGFEDLTDEQIDSIKTIVDFELIDVDDHGISRRYSIYEVDGNYWKVEFEHSSNEGIYRDCIDPPEQVERVEVVTVKWRPIPTKAKSKPFFKKPTT